MGPLAHVLRAGTAVTIQHCHHFTAWGKRMDQIAAGLDRYHISVATILATIGVLVVASIAIGLLNRLLRRWLARSVARFNWSYETGLLIARLVRGALWVVTGLLALDVWGVPIGGLWAILASAAAVIGVGFLATWTMVSNLTASFFITVWRPFQIGQVMEIVPENLKGRVVDHNLMFTVLREEGGSLIKIPNNLFFQKMFRVRDGQQTPFELHEADGDGRSG